MNILLRNAVNLEGKVIDVFIVDGNFSQGPSKGPLEEIDCTGLRILPGFVDLHTHLREPGYEQSETIASGSASAAAGGYTAVHAMANTFPVADSAGVVEQVFRLGEETGLVQVQPVGAVTLGLEGAQLAELGTMANSKAKVRVFSDDGKCVHDPLLMRRALEYVKAFDGVIAQHAQEPKLTVNAQMNESALSSQLGLAGWPKVAEESIIARDIMLAKHTDSRLHICHLSTAGSVDLVRRAKAEGVKVTAEVTPHHLFLTEDLVRSYDPIYKVNPPLRQQEDVEALREALIDGTIDVIATDHAPHPTESKDCEWAAASFGMVGLESAYSVAQHVLIDSGRSNWTRLAQVMSIHAARIGRLENQGNYLVPGSEANLTLVDENLEWESGSKTNSLSGNNPYAGVKFRGKVIHTIYRGRFSLRAGMIQDRTK